MSEKPLISVNMPAYNAGKYIGEAIRSTLNQTCQNVELIIINDCSTDNTLEEIKKFSDPRIKLFNNEKNEGIVFTRNRALRNSVGEYIAVLDADDICIATRFEKQVEYMKGNPDVGICGSNFCTLNNGKRINKYLPLSDNEIKAELLFNNPIAHSTVMMRSSILKKYNIQYNLSYHSSEDYELWIRMSAITKLANLPDILLNYRIHEQQITQVSFSVKERTKRKANAKFIKLLGLNPTEEEFSIHCLISDGKSKQDSTFLFEAEKWLLKVKRANEELNILDGTVLNSVLARYWMSVIGNSGIGIKALKILFSSELYRNANIRFNLFLKVLVKVFIKHRQY